MQTIENKQFKVVPVKKKLQELTGTNGNRQKIAKP